MWTANLKSIAKVEDRTRLIVIFSDGTDEIEKEYYLSSKQGLKSLVQNELNRLQDLYQFVGSLTPGPVDLTPDVVTPTQAELDALSYQNRLNTLRSIEKAVGLKILTGSEPLVTNLRAGLVNDFKTAYITFF